MSAKWLGCLSGVFLYCLCTASFSMAQRCNIMPYRYPMFSLENYGKVSDVSRNVSKPSDYAFEVILIDYPQSRNKTIAYYIGIDSMGSSHLSCVNVDSVFYNKVYDSSLIDIDSFSLKKDSVSEFYLSRCNTSLSYDNGKAILICNHLTKKYVYFYSTDGRMLDALEQSKEYPFLKYAYGVVKRIFQMLNLFRQQSFFPS